ncbi:hypothetical protein FRB96_000927 [Tulasnella sp. 330]|nr:hypothetical protein FRB96_000927 [Tulasnella sp. 330]KAG8872624.1 hypothetical protein FRB97_007488 [Tulasnella sp. 331]KAG8877193.1 hypothetical protein FRB98_006832 [Tulasnella sp. 332]
MHSFTSLALLALSTAVHGLPQTSSGGICIPAVYTGTPPNTVASTPGTAVTGLQLANSGGTAVLQANGFNDPMSFDDSQISVFDGFCSPDNLNVGAAGPGESSRILTWSYSENVGPPTWVGAFSQTIQVELTGGTATPAHFLACPSGAAGVWTLFLLTGKAEPVDGCVITELAVSANGLTLA